MFNINHDKILKNLYNSWQKQKVKQVLKAVNVVAFAMTELIILNAVTETYRIKE
jgi:hypothetical protein